MIMEQNNIRIFLLRKHFMEEQIYYYLNYVMIIAKLVIYLVYQIIIKNVLLVYLLIHMII